MLRQISAVSVTRESGDGGGRAGSEGPLAPRRLGAAWHWARLFPACPAVTVIRLPAAPVAFGVHPRYQSPGERSTPRPQTSQAALLTAWGGAVPVFLVCLGFFNATTVPSSNQSAGAGGHSGILLKIWFAWEDPAFHSSREDWREDRLFRLR